MKITGLLDKFFNASVSIAPLIVFRVLFGFMMAVSILRFALKGWISELYILPEYYFSYWGFEWIRPLPGIGMYVVFGVMFLAAIGVMLGAFYRVSASLFFLLFTYVELIDKTNYLNHYYFVSLVALLLCFVPAHRDLSVDATYGRVKTLQKIPGWCVNIFKLQLGLVYFYAGLAKLNYDWLMEAMPLKLWLPSVSDTPLIGVLFNHDWTAYLLSWSGALYDLTIPFLLLWSVTRGGAYLLVVVFHIMTAALFQIGIFPYVMIISTLIFFSENFHERMLEGVRRYVKYRPGIQKYGLPGVKPLTRGLLISFFLFQCLIPFRYLLYPNHLFWSEEGYRFSWRVMLMEKSGHTTFEVRDKWTDKKEWVANYEYLTPQQEKMMSTQPDMILQYAHYLADKYRDKGFTDPQVFCHSKVTLNGRRSQTFVDASRDLAMEKVSIRHKDWITQWQYD